jgi:hypothetical protein
MVNEHFFKDTQTLFFWEEQLLILLLLYEYDLFWYVQKTFLYFMNISFGMHEHKLL